VEIKPVPRAGGKSIEQLLALEAANIAAATRGFHVVALDERGRAWTTSELARNLNDWRDSALDVAFVIGSADGLADSVKRAANVVVSLSALTLPHGLARVILAEQLYRAASLLQGHPYHRE
jgi:23S rRNA (pseudouridine1915-N3)-methyltransferase